MGLRFVPVRLRIRRWEVVEKLVAEKMEMKKGYGHVRLFRRGM